MGQSKVTQRSYVIGPYLDKVIAIRKRANSEPDMKNGSSQRSFFRLFYT